MVTATGSLASRIVTDPRAAPIAASLQTRSGQPQYPHSSQCKAEGENQREIGGGGRGWAFVHRGTL